MKSDRIALVAGIVSLGLASVALPQSQGAKIAHPAGNAMTTNIAPILIMPNDPPSAKIATVFLLTGQ